MEKLLVRFHSPLLMRNGESLELSLLRTNGQRVIISQMQFSSWYRVDGIVGEPIE